MTANKSCDLCNTSYSLFLMYIDTFNKLNYEMFQDFVDSSKSHSILLKNSEIKLSLETIGNYTKVFALKKLDNFNKLNLNYKNTIFNAFHLDKYDLIVTKFPKVLTDSGTFCCFNIQSNGDLMEYYSTIFYVFFKENRCDSIYILGRSFVH